MQELGRKGCAPETLRSYRWNLQAFYKTLPEGRLQPGATQRWRDDLLQQGYQPNTVKHRLSSVNGMLSHLGLWQYQVENLRSLRRVAVSVVLSLLFLATVYLSVAVILTGDWFFHLLEGRLPEALARLLPLAALGRLWAWLRYLLLFCFVLLLVLMVYRAGTPRGASRSGVVLLTSLGAALAIVAASALFSWFIGLSSRYALVYGSLASLIVLLVWLYLCAAILLAGAAAGRVLDRRLSRPAQ